MIGVMGAVLAAVTSLPAQEAEETYAISLTKTADIRQDVVKVQNKKVLTEEITIQKGEHLWKILRRRGLLDELKRHNLTAILKLLNKSFENLDLVHPGDKVLIPLKIVPITATASRQPEPPEKERPALPPSALKDIDFSKYTVKPGDSLIKVVTDRYEIPHKKLHEEYLTLVRQLNPVIKNLNRIYPGQVVRLPIFSPEIVRKPIEAAALKKKKDKTENESKPQKVNPVARGLGRLFMEMGEEWVQTGQHYIPLKSGGQIDLKAASFPIVSLKNGRRVLIDLNGELPEQMADLIEASWSNYRVVHLAGEDDLKSSLDKVLAACDYLQILKEDQVLELQGDLPVRIRGEWMIKPDKTGDDDRPDVFVITLKDLGEPRTPGGIKAYLESLGVRMIDHPADGGDARPDRTPDDDAVRRLEDPDAFIECLLNLFGHHFSRDLEIPAYQSDKADLRLIIKADFFFKNKDKDAIIDLTGLSPDILDFLEKHRFMTLSLAGEKDPLKLVARILTFMDRPFKSGPQSFNTLPEDTLGNVVFIIKGMIFSSAKGKVFLVTPEDLPEAITAFLISNGYHILIPSFRNF